MKIYRETLKNIITAAVIATLLIAFFVRFRKNIGEALSVSWRLTVGENRSIATPEERLAYLQAHPKQIKLAMIGNWATGERGFRSRQNILTLAICKINQAGGVAGREIVPEWMDIHNSSDMLHEYVEKIAHDPSYYAIVGPSTSGQLLSVKPLLLSYKLLTIAPAVSNTNVVQPEDPPYIFLPNPSDAQDAEALRLWAQKNRLNNFILINENQPFSVGYAKHVERIFFENGIMISARTFFNPTDNISYFMDEMKNYADFFNVQNALIINYSAMPKTYERLAKWMLANTKGSVFSYKLLPGEFSQEEMKRMYTAVYTRRNEKTIPCINELAAIPGALQDAFAPATYRTIFLFADACRKAKSMHQNDVINILQQEELQGPVGIFRFNENRFEKNPLVSIVSVYQIHQFWGELLMNENASHPVKDLRNAPLAPDKEQK